MVAKDRDHLMSTGVPLGPPSSESVSDILTAKKVSTSSSIPYRVDPPGSPINPLRFAVLLGKFPKTAGDFKPNGENSRTGSHSDERWKSLALRLNRGWEEG